MRWGVSALRPIVPALILIGLSLAPEARAAGHEAIEAVGPGAINWTTGIVTATGLGALTHQALNAAQARALAERVAFSVAVRNLLETVKGVRVDSATVVDNLVVTNEVIKTRVTGLVKGARTIKTEQQPGGGVEVTVAISLTGELVDAVLPKGFGQPVSIPEPPATVIPLPSPVPALPPVSRPERAPALPALPTAPSPGALAAPPPPAVAAPISPIPTADSYTGLLVDARGLGLKPALAPRLLDEQGKELYAGGLLTREEAVEAGVAGYAKDLVAGSRQRRVTDRPLIVKGVRVSGNKGTDVVLGEESVKAIQQTEPLSHYLRQARVVMVYD